jgi:4-hydroxythreonine-4-phosphate dehydrogenase
LDGQSQGLVTCPISKWALNQAGYRWPGHTELLADLCGADHSAMMLYLPPGAARSVGGLGIVHVTLHVALRDAIRNITTPGIVREARLVHNIMRRFLDHYGVAGGPRIAVCALNPHGGEEGMFGDEELRVIAPAVRVLRSTGHRVEGPLPADTLLGRAFRGEFDGVVAMYHDQGHIAVKLTTMFAAVNITLGLPIVRTSVAHGTAFSIAGQGIANCEGLAAAVEACAVLVRTKAL